MGLTEQVAGYKHNRNMALNVLSVHMYHVLSCVCGKATQILVPVTFTTVGQNLGQLKLCHSVPVFSTQVIVRITWLVYL